MPKRTLAFVVETEVSQRNEAVEVGSAYPAALAAPPGAFVVSPPRPTRTRTGTAPEALLGRRGVVRGRSP